MNWRRFFKREEADADLRQELESYLEITTNEYVARGMDPDAARAAARRKLGNSTLVREEIYYMNTIPFVESLSTALRYWFRTLGREPMFTAAATLTLALGIGATTAIFSVVNGVLIKPLPYPAADELLSVSHSAPGMGFAKPVGMSPSMLFTYREEGHVFQSIGGWSPDAATVTGLTEPERIRTLLITFGTLQVLNVPPLMGRWLSQEDDTEGTPEVVLLSYGYWQRRFGGDPSVVGRGITVDSRPRQIIGVMPPSFFRLMGQDPDLFIPLRFDRNRLHLGDLGFLGIARLKPGVSLAQANSDVARMLPIWLRSWPGPNASFGREVFEKARFSPALRPLKDDVVGSIGRVLWLVMGAVGLILLIACANVANLLLVKAESRQHERGIRLALGAGRAQILRESLAESLLLRCGWRFTWLSLCVWRTPSVALYETRKPASTPGDLHRRLGHAVRAGRVALFVSAVWTASSFEIRGLPTCPGVAHGWPFRRYEPRAPSCAKCPTGGTGLSRTGSSGDVVLDAAHLPGDS
jgi:predicted permease